MEPKIVYIEALLTSNGEVIHFGKSLGYIDKKQFELIEKGACQLTKRNQPVVELTRKKK